ncbi:MAG: phospho-sugar mutase, partial [Flavobacteriia bacterium]|nr:phospho-sugar mutase [Flavobacteriia bacterium]
MLSSIQFNVVKQSIKFGTDGWRAIIAQEFTVENVARVTEATGIWLNERFEKASVVVGHDCRFGGELFMHTVAAVLVQQGIKVFMAEGFVSTPMISLAAHRQGCEIGIILTASHNPPADNGYKVYLGGVVDGIDYRGSQIISPADAQIAQEISKVSSLLCAPR